MWLELLHGSCLRRAARENGFNWKHRRRESKIIPCDLILQGAKGSSLKSHKASFPARRSPGPEGTSRSCRVCCSPCHVQVRRLPRGAACTGCTADKNWPGQWVVLVRWELCRAAVCCGFCHCHPAAGFLCHAAALFCAPSPGSDREVC